MNAILLRKLINIPWTIYNFFLLKRKGVMYGRNVMIWGKLYMQGSGTMRIGSNVIIVSTPSVNPDGGGVYCCFTLHGGEITIGNNVGISQSSITAVRQVIIEDDVMIGTGCMIADTDFHSLYARDRICHQETLRTKTAPVVIRRGAMVGARCIVLKGVTIGEKSFIGAGSVVTKSIPNGEIWAGNPARFIRKMTVEELND